MCGEPECYKADIALLRLLHVCPNNLIRAYLDQHHLLLRFAD